MRRPVVLLLALTALAAGCGGSDEEEGPSTSGRTTTEEARPDGPALPPVGERGLALGLAEIQPALIDPGEVPAAFAPWRDRVARLEPAVARVVVDWSGLQPSPDRPAELAQQRDGCQRNVPPCAPYAGLRDQLRALAARQDASPGAWAGLLDVYGVPEWAARRATGCERPGTEPRSRPITAQGLDAYRELLRDVLALAREEGAEIGFVSPWNEPNQSFFVSPQRARCSRDSRPVSVDVYARLVGAAREVLDEAEGDLRLVVGEIAGTDRPTPRGTGVGEFARALPDEVLCEADVVAQHEYAELPDEDKSDNVRELIAALDERACTRDVPVWVTETGVGAPGSGRERDTSPAALRAQCRALARALRGWWRDPRVQLAVQFTYREDLAFAVGLADVGLTREYPAARLLRAYAQRDAPTDPPPAASACDRDA